MSQLVSLAVIVLILPLALFATEAGEGTGSCRSFIQSQEQESEHLNTINKTMAELKNRSSSIEKYQEVRGLWLDLTGLVYSVGAFDEGRVREAYNSPKVVAVLESEAVTEEDDIVVLDDENDREAPIQECISLLGSTEKTLHLKALKSFVLASQLRSHEIGYQREIGDNSIFRWTDEYFKDNLVEIKVIPLRWVGIFTSKFNRFQQDMSLGLEGWVRVGTEGILLITFLFSLIFSIWLAIHFPEYSAPYRESTLKFLFARAPLVKVGLWLQRLLPYFPWVMLLLLMKLESTLIENTYFSDLRILLPYVGYYAFYKMAHIFLSQILLSYLSFGRGIDFSKLRGKVESTVTRLSNFIVWSLVLLHTAESAIGRGFIYLWIYKIFFVGLIIIFILESKKWEKEIENMIRSIVPEKYCGAIIRFVDKSYFLRSIILLTLSLFFYVFVVAYRWIQTLEISKTIAARLFRERVKSATKSGADDEMSTDKKHMNYMARFSQPEVEVEVSSQAVIVDELSEFYRKWQEEGITCRNFGLIGGMGSGKSTIINKVMAGAPGVRFKSFSFRGRSGRNQALKAVKEAILTEKEKVVFCVDDAHFLFLSKVGGFERIKEFFTLLDTSPDHISWLVSMNSNSSTYLGAILNETMYFSQIYDVPKWSEAEISELISRRHKLSDTVISFDKILLAMRSDNMYEAKKYVEEKYFRLLWEEAIGNPVVAMALWVSSLQSTSRDKHFNVGIPKSRSEQIKGLPSEFYFTLASIVRHGAISLGDLATATDSHRDYVRNVIEVCGDKEYLSFEKGLISINPLWLNNIILTLSGKNYIYGKK